MKLLELYRTLDDAVKRHERFIHRLDHNVMIKTSSPSMGFSSAVEVANAYFGIDWDSGRFFIQPSKSLVIKSEKEKVWDMAFDHIYTMSLQLSPKGNPTSAAKWAKEVLRRAKED